MSNNTLDRVTKFQENDAPLWDEKYGNILEQYTKRFQTLQGRPDIENLVIQMIENLETGSENQATKTYTKLLSELDQFINSHLYEFRKLPVDSQEYNEMKKQLQGVIVFLKKEREGNTDQNVIYNIDVLIKKIQQSLKYIEESVKSGQKSASPFTNFVTKLNGIFGKAIKSLNLSSKETRDLLLNQISTIDSLHINFLKERKVVKRETKEQIKEGQKNILFEPFSILAEDTLTNFGGYHPGVIMTGSNTPEALIAFDEIAEVQGMNEKQLNVFSSKLRLLEKDPFLGTFDIGKIKTDTELMKTLGLIIKENPSLLRRLKKKYPQEYSQGISPAIVFGKMILQNFAISKENTIQKSFDSLKKQLTDPHSSQILFQFQPPASHNGTQPPIKSKVIDFKPMFSDPTSSLYIADVGKREKSIKLARSRSIVAGMVFLKRLQSQPSSQEEYNSYAIKNILKTGASLWTAQIFGIENYLVNGIVGATWAIATSITLYQNANVLGRAPFVGKKMRINMFRYNKHIRTLYGDLTTAEKNGEDTTEILKKIEDLGLSKKELEKIRGREKLIDFFISKAENEISPDEKLKKRLEVYREKYMFIKNDKYFHNMLARTTIENKFLRSVMGITGKVAHINPQLNLIINEIPKRFIGKTPRKTDSGKRKLLSAEEYHKILLKKKFLMEFSGSPFISEKTSKIVSIFAEENRLNDASLKEVFEKINKHLVDMRNIKNVGTTFDESFQMGITKHIEEIITGSGDSFAKLDNILASIEEKLTERRKLGDIFGTIGTGKSSYLRVILIEKGKRTIAEANSKEVSDGIDEIGEIYKKRESINSALERASSLSSENITPEQEQILQEHYKKRLGDIIDTGADIGNGVQELDQRMGKIKSLFDPVYREVLPKLFHPNGTINTVFEDRFVEFKNQLDPYISKGKSVPKNMIPDFLAKENRLGPDPVTPPRKKPKLVPQIEDTPLTDSGDTHPAKEVAPQEAKKKPGLLKRMLPKRKPKPASHPLFIREGKREVFRPDIQEEFERISFLLRETSQEGAETSLRNFQSQFLSGEIVEIPKGIAPIKGLQRYLSTQPRSEAIADITDIKKLRQYLTSKLNIDANIITNPLSLEKLKSLIIEVDGLQYFYGFKDSDGNIVRSITDKMNNIDTGHFEGKIREARRDLSGGIKEFHVDVKTGGIKRIFVQALRKAL